MITLKENQLIIETKTQSVVMQDGAIVSLKSKSGKSFVNVPDVSAVNALSAVYMHNRSVNISNGSQSKIKCMLINDYCAEFRVHSWHGDGMVMVYEDQFSGDLIVEPSVFSGQHGLRSVRWAIPGIDPELEVIAPLYQGIKMKQDDPMILGGRWVWPQLWEAGFVIMQGKSDGFWVHCEDTKYKYKTLSIGLKDMPNSLGFETDAYGPIDNNSSAGGLQWRINCYDGDWHVPAKTYKDWLYNAYNLAEQKAVRKDWIYDIKAAISWFPTEKEALDLVAKYADPTKMLLHVPNWREFKYDQNYPDYTPSQKGADFIEYGKKLGFHMMPHGNSVDMDPTHPVYQLIREYEYIDIESKARHGWGWSQGGYLGVPSSNQNLTENQKYNVMIKVHPASRMWQSILREELEKAVKQLEVDTIFIDVTLCSQNLHNSLLDSTTSSEGMNQLIRHIGQINGGIPVGGEGLNEITFQGLSFAQAHLFNSHQGTAGGLERCGGIDLNEFLFGDLCRTIGYSSLGGRNDAEKLRMRIHEEHGAIPTCTIGVNELKDPNAEILRVLAATKK